ncbi:MAG: hypothetical protein KGD59_12320 [Candidatus Heimdallarchaeota archaeon]|nr:hypothetical protein [Candidatus Heimdallarchaeota archaeon]MBY8995329.1 hypothetical protein [Candidatus Heimdallarchaeota archaeon]
MSKKQKNERKIHHYLKRLLDPIVIIFIVFWIYSINMLAFFFRTPGIFATDLFADTITQYFWNGNYSILDIELDSITEGFTADFPKQFSWVFIVAAICFVLLTTIGIALAVFKQGINRFKIIRIVIWPLFIIASMIIGSVIVFFNWGASLKTEDIVISYGRVVMLNFVVSLLFILLVLILSAYLSNYEKNRASQIINSS